MDSSENNLIDDVNTNEIVCEREETSEKILLKPEEDKKKEVNELPTLELKDLPSHLKYVFLGDNKTFPVIIALDLTEQQEERLVSVLSRYRKAMGWSLHDIVVISPTMCMHKIDLEEGAKPMKDFQRRLNLNMPEVVKKEVILLEEGIIYPIANSEWVSHVHVVPMKAGFTMQENDKGEMILVRKTTRWRMCIDLRKLNLTTKKIISLYPL